MSVIHEALALLLQQHEKYAHDPALSKAAGELRVRVEKDSEEIPEDLSELKMNDTGFLKLSYSNQSNADAIGSAIMKTLAQQTQVFAQPEPTGTNDDLVPKPIVQKIMNVLNQGSAQLNLNENPTT